MKEKYRGTEMDRSGRTLAVYLFLILAAVGFLAFHPEPCDAVTARLLKCLQDGDFCFRVLSDSYGYDFQNKSGTSRVFIKCPTVSGSVGGTGGGGIVLVPSNQPPYTSSTPAGCCWVSGATPDGGKTANKFYCYINSSWTALH